LNRFVSFARELKKHFGNRETILPAAETFSAFARKRSADKKA
jgi:hypothetical protein